ncbi:MAG: hypothetical protein ABWJ97_04670 [Thermoproteus sp.]
MPASDIFLLSAAGGIMAAAAPLLYLMYYAKETTFVRLTGALVSFVAGFVFTLLALQWGLFYLRFTYLLALALLLTSIAYTYWGMYRDEWTMYLFAAAAWIYIIILAVIAKALGLGDPFFV